MCHIVTSVIDTVASDHGSTDCSRSISDLRGTRGVMGAETDNMSSLGGGCCYNHFHLILGGVIRQCCNMETQAYISLITLLRSDIGWCCQDPSTWQIGGPQYLSIFSTDDDDLVLTRVRHSCLCTSLQGEIQYSFDRQAVLDKSKKTLGILSNHMHCPCHMFVMRAGNPWYILVLRAGSPWYILVLRPAS